MCEERRGPLIWQKSYHSLDGKKNPFPEREAFSDEDSDEEDSEYQYEEFIA